ncbi:MAG: lyase family protein [Desulfitobacteriaceae bacterium]
MLDFIKKSPFGFILAVIGIVLVASPEAREAVRKAAVRSTAAVLDFADKAKNSPGVKGYLTGETGETGVTTPTNHDEIGLT